MTKMRVSADAIKTHYCKCGVALGPSNRTGLCMSCSHKGSRNGNFKHGKYLDATFQAYSRMLMRCGYTNSEMKDGYERVTVCDRWLESFENFHADASECPGPGYELDRIRNAGNYEPGNVQWLTSDAHKRKRRQDNIDAAMYTNT